MTDAAARFLAKVLATGEPDTPQTLRIAVVDGNYMFSQDDARDGDLVIEHDGKHLLVLDPQIAQALSGVVLDTHKTPAGARLSLSKV